VSSRIFNSTSGNSTLGPRSSSSQGDLLLVDQQLVNSLVMEPKGNFIRSPYVPVKGAGRAVIRSALTLLSARSQQPDQETIDLSSGSGSSDCSSSKSEVERITIVTRTSRRTKTETWWCHVTVQTDSEGESEKEGRKKRRAKRRNNKCRRLLFAVQGRRFLPTLP
jgi:hypothetical protein